MRLITILFALIMSTNFSLLHAQNAEEEPLTYEQLENKLENTKRDKDKVAIYMQMIVLKKAEIDNLNKELNQTQQELDSINGIPSLQYLTDDISIFTQDLPEQERIAKSLYPFAEAIALVKNLQIEIDKAKDIVNKGESIGLPTEQIKNNTDLPDQMEKLKEMIDKFDAYDTNMFSKAQITFMRNLFDEYYRLENTFK